MGATEWTWAWPWWGTIVAINAINLIVGLVIFIKSKKSENGHLISYRRNMRILGIIFISVGVYRSIFVSRYLTQLAWFDTLANSPLLIRCLALFAEMAFAILIMKTLLQVNKDVPIPENHKSKKFLYFIETKSPYIFVWCLFIAQFFAFGGTINKIRVLFAIEETLWGIGFLLITILVVLQLKRVYSVKDEQSKRELKHYRIFTVFFTIFGVGYCIYSLLYHLPIEYWPAAVKQLQMAVPEPAIRTGIDAIKDAFLIVNETKDYAAWGGLGFVIWHSGYFALCEWMVLFFMNGPRKLDKNSL